jgi:hypothetical protein
MPKMSEDLAKQLLEEAGFPTPDEWVKSTVRLYNTLDDQLESVSEADLVEIEPHYIQPPRPEIP